MYAKMSKNGRLEVYRGTSVELDGRRYINPTKAILARLGYKPLISGEAPAVPKGMALSVDYAETDDSIKTVYTLVGGAV